MVPSLVAERLWLKKKVNAGDVDPWKSNHHFLEVGLPTTIFYSRVYHHSKRFPAFCSKGGWFRKRNLLAILRVGNLFVDGEWKRDPNSKANSWPTQRLGDKGRSRIFFHLAGEKIVPFKSLQNVCEVQSGQISSHGKKHGNHWQPVSLPNMHKPRNPHQVTIFTFTEQSDHVEFWKIASQNSRRPPARWFNSWPWLLWVRSRGTNIPKPFPLEGPSWSLG